MVLKDTTVGLKSPDSFFVLTSYQVIYTVPTDHFSQSKTVSRVAKYQRTDETHKCAYICIRWGESQEGKIWFSSFCEEAVKEGKF